MRNRKILSGVFAFVLIFAATGIVGINTNDKNNLLTKTAKASNPAPKGVFSILEQKNKVILEKYKNAHNLTDSQLKELLKATGFSGKSLVEAWAIAKKESNGRPLAFNSNIRTGDSSFGVFQINMIGDLGPDRRDKYDLTYNAELFSPVKNAEVAYLMSDGGKDWSSWNGITPRTKAWIKEFPR